MCPTTLSLPSAVTSMATSATTTSKCLLALGSHECRS